MSVAIVSLCLAGIIFLYFWNNPLKHGRWFMLRRFINWFPLGMTYAFLYMGRYNLNVAKIALDDRMSKEDFGIIFAAGTITYAFSFLVNGPIVDRLGGKMGILIAALGSSVANILMGVLTYLVMTGRLQVKLVVAFSLLYSLNMYFQSYGAVSIIKVKAYWFHVRERGTFGAIFGTLISFGVYFAFDWGKAIADAVRVNAPNGLLSRILKPLFSPEHQSIDAFWAVFFVPAAIMIFWAILDALCIKDTPEQAKFPPFDPCDASSGHMNEDLSALDLLKKVFLSPLMLMFAFIELTTGVLRNGIYQWYPIFAKEVPQTGATYFGRDWGLFFGEDFGLLLCVFGIIGGFAGGLISDKFFRSRRGPPAVFFSAFMFVLALLMFAFLGGPGSIARSPIIVGSAAVLISAAVIGVHSLMSGTAAADFGGRKATATCSGIVDGFVYLGSTIQSLGIGFLTTRTHNWHYWPAFLAPFALLGTILALRIWKALPEATKKYIQEVEGADVGNVEGVEAEAEPSGPPVLQERT